MPNTNSSDGETPAAQIVFGSRWPRDALSPQRKPQRRADKQHRHRDLFWHPPDHEQKTKQLPSSS